MKYRKLGKTGYNVSEVGFGAWGIGGMMWQDSDDKESMRTLHKAADLGVNFIDTALAYGGGHSEQLISKFLKERKEKFVVATKIPPKNLIWPAKKGIPVREVFPPDYITKCTEQSLKNLGTDIIDIQQFHVWDDDWMEDELWWNTIEKLKKDGKIKCFGVSINDHEPDNALKLVQSGRVDSVQVIFNIFDQSPQEKLFPLCKEKNVGVIVRVPFDEGGLTGKITSETTFPKGDWRNNYFKDDRKKQVFERVSKMKIFLNEEVKTMPELALKFCLSNDAVSTVITGVRKVSHIEENAKCSEGKVLSPKLLEDLKSHKWIRNFYN